MGFEIPTGVFEEPKDRMFDRSNSFPSSAQRKQKAFIRSAKDDFILGRWRQAMQCCQEAQSIFVVAKNRLAQEEERDKKLLVEVEIAEEKKAAIKKRATVLGKERQGFFGGFEKAKQQLLENMLQERRRSLVLEKRKRFHGKDAESIDFANRGHSRRRKGGSRSLADVFGFTSWQNN